MRSARLLVFLGLIAAPLALVPLVPAPIATADRLLDLSGRWRVESVLVSGQQSLRPEFEEVVFTATTAEYVSPTPVVAPTPSRS